MEIIIVSQKMTNLWAFKVLKKKITNEAAGFETGTLHCAMTYFWGGLLTIFSQKS